jgi:monofunctional glycosyltransferase
VSDSEHGDEPGPADTKEAGSPMARVDTSSREHVADAIPTVAPHPPRLPSQVPPWAEDAVSPDSIGDPLGEEPVSPEPTPGQSVSLEPAPPPSGAAEDSEGQELEAIADPPALTASNADATAPRAETVDAAVALEDPEHTAVEPIPESTFEPQLDVSSPSESNGPSAEPVALPISDAVAAEPLVEPPGDPEADMEIELQAPPAPDTGMMPALPSAAAHLSLLDASGPAPFDASATKPEPEGRDVDAPLPDDRPVSIHEEQIWSSPEAIESSVRWPEPERIDTHPEPAPEIDARAGLEAPTPQLTSRPDGGVETARIEAALPPPFVSSSLSVTERSALLPASARAREAISYVRRAALIAGGVVATLTATVLLLVVLYRWIDPPTSTLMLGQRLTGVEIEQKWVPIERISPNLVHAVILSEDGGFCRHRGVDWSALEEAIESARGGSTITMQVVKNLFLWPQRSYIRKALEIMLAYVVEAVWSKERILEIYLNIAEWGPGVFGAEAASRHHFGKAAARLTAQEAAQLAVSLPSPIERQAGYPGWQTRRLADNLLVRMRAVRTTMRCARVRRSGA